MTSEFEFKSSFVDLVSVSDAFRDQCETLASAHEGTA